MSRVCESCGCGASISVESATFTMTEALVGSFRAEHAVCREQRGEVSGPGPNGTPTGTVPPPTVAPGRTPSTEGDEQ